MAGDQFSLCWDNFHSNMSNGLTSLLKTEDLVDVTLAAEGRYLKAHKMVLSVCSPYFRELFQVNPCKHPIVFLKDVSYNALNNLLEFMYQGEVKVSQDELGTFIKTAEALKIKGLTGDGANANEAEPEPTIKQNNSVETETAQPTPNRKTHREKSPPVRKKMLGPASKRFKAETVVSPAQVHREEAPVQSETVNNDHAQDKPTIEQIMLFKTEPEDDTAATQPAEEDNGHYDDSAMDDIGIDNSTDYMMDSSSSLLEPMKEAKAGCSTATDNNELMGDNQGLYKFVVTQLGTLNLALHQHLYRPRNLIAGTTKRLWICTWRDQHCPARCISHAGKLVAKRGMHNHPPQRDVIAAKEAGGQICFRKLF